MKYPIYIFEGSLMYTYLIDYGLEDELRAMGSISKSQADRLCLSGKLSYLRTDELEE